MNHWVRLLACSVVAATSVLASNAAHAGVTKDYIDIIYVKPVVGAEIGRIGHVGVDNVAGVASGDQTFAGFSYGAGAGFRFGALSLGAMYQRTNADNALDLNKLYGEVGINVRTKYIMTVLNFDFGWAFIDQNSGPTSPGAISSATQMVVGRQDSFGGKIGVAVDFYPLKWLALGVGASLDLQGFLSNNQVVGSYGGTFTARAGIHL